MKRLALTIFSILAISLVVLAASPAPAVAGPPTGFTASGLAWLAGIPGATPVGIIGAHWKILNEPVDGVVSSSDWSGIAGAGFTTTHNSEVTFFPNGTFRGQMKGTFTLTSPSGTLSGTIDGRFTGNWIASAEGPLVTNVSDEGSWGFTSGTGVFSGTNGEGKWSAELTWNGETLFGALTFQGKYRQ